MIEHMKTTLKRAQEVSISEFKAKCISLLHQVTATKTSLRITRRGKPIADVVPVSSDLESKEWMGSMSNHTELGTDIVSPVIEIADIEALKS